MNYGLPYKGSKEKIADRILDLMPSAGKFYDLFAGGMAVTHAAMLRNKFGKVICNDINGEMMTFFVEASEDKESVHLPEYTEAQEELADILICCMTELVKRGVNVDKIIDAKIKFNENR